MERLSTFLFVAAGIALAFVALSPQIITPQASAQSAAAAPQATTTYDFNQTGVLVFYPNNVGPVPYLFYQDARGTTVSKALVFATLTPNELSPWSAARVTVIGTLEDEHVTVNTITYVAGP